MTRLNQPTAIALATAARLIRSDWDHAGILHALEVEARKGTSCEDAAVALMRICRRKDVRTPGFLNQPGNHWDDEKGEAIRRRGDASVACPTHGKYSEPCPHPDHRGDMTPEQVAAAAAECLRIAAEAKAAAQERRAAIETKRQEANA